MLCGRSDAWTLTLSPGGATAGTCRAEFHRRAARPPRGAPPSQPDPRLCPRDAPLPPPRSVPTTPCYSCRKMPPRAHAGAVLVLLSLSFGLAAGE